MQTVNDILQLKVKPKEIQRMLVEAVVTGEIPVNDFVLFFESAPDKAKGSCADAMKHISSKDPALLVPFIDILVQYINHKSPRVKWGVPEAIGNMAKDFPDEVVKAIPYLLKNITDDEMNTTVIRWCSAFALSEIAKYSLRTRKQLIPLFEKLVLEETNNGVRNVYVKSLKAIEKH